MWGQFRPTKSLLLSGQLAGSIKAIGMKEEIRAVTSPCLTFVLACKDAEFISPFVTTVTHI